MNDRNLTPTSDRVLLEMKPRIAETGGLVLPEYSRTTSDEGTVVGVGPEVKDLSIGDSAFPPPKVGTHFRQEGKDYLILRESQVLGKRVP